MRGGGGGGGTECRWEGGRQPAAQKIGAGPLLLDELVGGHELSIIPTLV
jgi:hypothetical protein